jgi:hypothetical protein
MKLSMKLQLAAFVAATALSGVVFAAGDQPGGTATGTVVVE